jgi:hypothetical protein
VPGWLIHQRDRYVPRVPTRKTILRLKNILECAILKGKRECKAGQREANELEQGCVWGGWVDGVERVGRKIGGFVETPHKRRVGGGFAMQKYVTQCRDFESKALDRK